MHRNGPLLLLVCVALWTVACAAPAATVEDIVGLVDQAQYTAYLSDEGFLYTHYGDNREWGAEHDLARDNVAATLGSLGLDTSLHEFRYQEVTYANVVAVLPGKVTPEQVYVVGAHLDSSNNRDPGSEDGAPGADDNASGVAAILEAARVLSQYEFASTLTFVAFDREEQGMRGSWAYAADHQADDIRGMVSVDMIAYQPLGPEDPDYYRARIYYAEDDTELTGDLADALQLYGGISAQVGRLGSSDHAAFDAHGFSAALLIEDAVWENPNYHEWTDSVDTPGYINYDYATRMTRGVVGYLATAAVIVPEPSSLGMLAIFLLCAGIGVRWWWRVGSSRP